MSQLARPDERNSSPYVNHDMRAFGTNDLLYERGKLLMIIMNIAYNDKELSLGKIIVDLSTFSIHILYHCVNTKTFQFAVSLTIKQRA